jgi:hypothetical protein
MKIRIMILIMLVLTLILPATLQAQETDSVAVLSALEGALNAGDVEAAMALFTDDAVVSLALFDETYAGTQEIRAWFEELVAGNFELHLEVLEVDGYTVTTKTTTWIDFTREMGIAPLVATEIYTFQDGKITGFIWTPTDETASKIQAVLATLPETGGVALPTYALATILGTLAIISGLSLALLRRRSLRPS